MTQTRVLSSGTNVKIPKTNNSTVPQQEWVIECFLNPLGVCVCIDNSQRQGVAPYPCDLSTLRQDELVQGYNQVGYPPHFFFF